MLAICFTAIRFPFLFGGTFIEALSSGNTAPLSWLFPFLFGGTFIEAPCPPLVTRDATRFPFLFGGTFIEAEGALNNRDDCLHISLPFRRDFH